MIHTTILIQLKTNFVLCTLILLCFSCNENKSKKGNNSIHNLPIGLTKSKAKTPNGQYISWKEHIIDDTKISGIGISGSDGLQMADLDKDGFEDIVSVHESDTEYDGELIGHIRIAFGSIDPDKWELVTLASGPEAAAAEDITLTDLNGDGFLDIIAACELAHLIYFQNPTKNSRTTKWKRLIPKITQNRGSFIRVFSADLNQDGQPEIISANKGDQANDGTTPVNVGLKPVSYFEIKGNPLIDTSWNETVLVQLAMPINAQPIDIDQDGDIDIIAGARRERRILLLENISEGTIQFKNHPIQINGLINPQKAKLPDDGIAPKSYVTGFNMEFLDVNEDGRKDIIIAESFLHLIWLEQPAQWTEAWQVHPIGSVAPDWVVGMKLADINNDSHLDIISGGYSRGTRDTDGTASIGDALGRLAWFENPNDSTIPWRRHDISRRKRGMFDQFVARDLDQDGDMDFIATRGNSLPYDGVFWLEQIRSDVPKNAFEKARVMDSEEMALPAIKMDELE